MVGGVNSNWQLPPDPFANDPNDPASFFEDDEPFPPLSDEERARMKQDLKLMREFRRVLAPKGVQGIFFYCEDCTEEHFYDWDIMEANMLSTLAEEQSAVHEPSPNPDPHNYVPWDYCLGYLDGIQQR
nr:DUF5319 domain-containing protein [Corynebacterium sp. 76QC2CO]